MVKLTKAKTFQAYLDSCHRRYSCVHCRAHLANHDDLISKSFQGSQGRAYLFNSVVNIGCGPAEERLLLTGLHAVADIYCENCHTTLGWKYVSDPPSAAEKFLHGHVCRSWIDNFLVYKLVFKNNKLLLSLLVFKYCFIVKESQITACKVMSVYFFCTKCVIVIRN
uniref:Protein yippee-like n=1 Tax=Nothobranchius furzeri TaxID=105023 RepID=A0A8C6KIH5_NOTFU